ncbi:MAG: hypothetical protein LBS62_03360 [Clostridiales bacterium]|nr:hypothetical protein [Clostridiales bacterium]
MGGWKRGEAEFDADRTALVVMHAWECGDRELYPGWHRAVEYFPRARDILRTCLPKVLKSARDAGLTVFHVSIPGPYLSRYPGYALAESLASPSDCWADEPRACPDPFTEEIQRFRSCNIFPGAHNKDDIARGFAALDFPEEAKPLGNEGIAVSTRQLAALCRQKDINHLIYTGFAINGCLMTSPGGIPDMARLGWLCSVISQAVTAIENRESAEAEWGKQMALWFVSLLYGCVYDDSDFIRAMDTLNERSLINED